MAKSDIPHARSASTSLLAATAPDKDGESAKQARWQLWLEKAFKRTPLPARLAAQLRKEEETAERLISLVQLAVISFFAALYIIAPRAEGSGGFNYVPYALAAYAGFTVFRLAVCLRGKPPLWLVVLSIFVDVALVMGLLFSFHLQYDQHATFYLKSPTLAYVFVFIALRALRFDPRLVLLTGAVAASGWLLLVFYALLQDDGMARITRNYVEYLTANTMLVGAEMDKFIIITAVTLILALALQRSRRVLLSAIKEQVAVEDLSRYFPQGVASSIVEAGDELKTFDATCRQATIMFIDIRGFTKASERIGAAKTMRVLSCYQQLAIRAIKQHNGEIDKFLGDGIMVTFGALTHSSTDSADAIRAAQALLSKIGDMQPHFTCIGWEGAFQIGIGVACGRVNLGVIGVDTRREFTVIGDAVNRAAKLEAATKQANTHALTDKATYARACSQGLGAKLQNSNLRHIAGIEGNVDPVAIPMPPGPSRS